MKTIVAKVMMFGLFVTMLASCKKDPSMPSIDVVNVKTDSVAAITAISAEASCSVYADCTERGVCWGKTANPTCDGLHVANGKGKGSYVCTMNELEPGQQYFCRAYGYDGKHYVYAREEKTFVTRDGVPVLTAGTVSEVALSSAKCTFSVTDDGGLPVKECGVCWGTEAEPTVEGQTQTAENVGDVCVCELSGLEPNSTYYVRPYAKNDYRVGYGAAVSFTTGTALLLPTVTTVEVTDVTATSAICTGNVSSDGGAEVTERGACWSTTENPTINGTHLASGSGTGSFTVSMTGLTPNATYYVCTYATNSEGTAYGEQKTFTTTEGLAVVTTGSVTEVTATSAKCGGNVTDQGASAVTERGICWSTAENPTTSGNHASSGTGTGNFTVSMTGLTPNATYYVRAYAINTQGTAYGDEVSFRTSQNISAPTVTTSQVTYITPITAIGGGNVRSSGGANVTERGICWSTSHNPTTSGSHASNGTGTGNYTVQMTGLTPGTTYYVKAYAINSQDISYGDEVSFTTQSGTGGESLTFTANGVSFEMIEVEGGTFWMGAQNTNTSGQNYDSEASDDEHPVHQVTLSSYHIGKFEVTQQLWKAVMGNNPSYFANDSLHPVEQVNWNECQTFITALNELCASQLNGMHFALPTEAQWEFAARGGKQSQGYKYSGSNTLTNVAWYSVNTTHTVGTKMPNELGLYDMSGNVWEWCSDWYDNYGSSAQTDPTGPATGSDRVIRGGGWSYGAVNCRVSSRDSRASGNTRKYLGLRLVLCQ